MTSRAYRHYSEDLKQYGYEYLPNQPYKDANTWRKMLRKDEDFVAQVLFRVWENTDIETGDPVFIVRGKGIVEFKDGCPHRLEVDFGHRPDLEFVGAQMEKMMAVVNGIG